MTITYVVQAKCAIGWMDSRTCTSIDDAKVKETELKAKDDAWMPAHHGENALPRETRIVPVAESNCAHRYN